MDTRFGTQEGLYEILEQADALPGLAEIRIGRWLAWPAVKVNVYARLFANMFPHPGRGPFRPPLARGAMALVRTVPALVGLRKALAAVPRPGDRPRIAWLVGTRPSCGPDGVVRDSIFDELPRELAAHADQVWLAPPVVTDGPEGIPARGAYDAATRLAAALEPLQRVRPRVRSAASAMAGAMATLAATAGGVPWAGLLLDSLANFEARRLAWGPVMRDVRPRVLVMTDAPYFAGEIAAARESGVRVAEFQHGLFGPRCPEYGWPGAFAAVADRMPVADDLAVFGELFRGAALQNGFWKPEHVHVVGSAVLERHRRADAGRTAEGPAPRILFFTQMISRDDALRFWNDFLAMDGSAATVTIKVHPEERTSAGSYAELAARFPARCVVAADGADPLRLIREHDVVASYTSNALIEAVGLNRAAVSLAGRQAPDGVFGLCPIPGAGGAIPRIDGPATLVRWLAARAGTPNPLVAAASRGFYADGCAGGALAACLDGLS